MNRWMIAGVAFQMLLSGQAVAQPQGAQGGAVAEMEAQARRQAAMRNGAQNPGMKKKRGIAYPTPTFQATNGRTKRNVARQDLSSCGHYYGGPLGSFVPANKKPGIGAPPGVHGIVGGGYTGNCDRKEAFAMGSVMEKGSFIRGMTYFEDVGSYKDGDGDKVRFGNKKKMGQATIGYASANQKFALTGGVVRKEDILFGGAPVDTPELNVNFGKFNYKIDNTGKLINKIRVMGLFRGMDRTNENFSLRNLPAGKPKVRVKLDNHEVKGRAMFGFRAARMQHLFGGGIATENRYATRYRDHGMLGQLAKQNLNFADANIDKFSAIYKGVKPLSPLSRMKVWGQLDHVEASAGKANEVQAGRPGTAPQTSNELWLATYGVTGDDTKTENNFSASLRYEKDFAPGSQWFVEGGRYMRTADMHERFFSSWAGPAGGGPQKKNYAGNPEIDPEAHHKISAGFKTRMGSASFGLSGYADFASDYIIQDHARGQDGVLLNDGSNIYRNVDAHIYAIASDFNWHFAPGWKLGLWGQYAYGENTEDDRAIAQIPALEGQLKLEYNQPMWGLGGRVRGVTKQTRADIDPLTGSAQDDEETPGFVTLDLFASIRPVRFAKIKFGVENIFDTTYKEHIERVDVGDPDKTRVNMPGRTFWVRGSVKF